MPWKKGEKIPTNLIVGFLGSGKTTAISKLIDQRKLGENWSVLVNEFGEVSIDHALLESEQGVAIEELGGGCVCCTLSFAFKPLLAQFVRRTKPDRLILEPSGVSHPAKVVDILRSDNFSGVIDLRNIICLVDPKDFDDPRWHESDIFQDQVQLADIVALNWSDCRDRNQIDRCRAWVEQFRPPKQLIIETSFGTLDPALLDLEFEVVREPLFVDAHPLPTLTETHRVQGTIEQVDLNTGRSAEGMELSISVPKQPQPGQPMRFENHGANFDACGWIFHLEDVFHRNRLLDYLGAVRSMVRLKGIFQCTQDWWMINRAKDGTRFSPSTYRRDSRLEVIVTSKHTSWDEFEKGLLQCLANSP